MSPTAPSGPNADDLSLDEARRIAAVEVSLSASTLGVGDSTQATVTYLNRRGDELNRTTDWSSSNTNIAVVSAAGLVRALAAGTASITACHLSHCGSAELSVTGDSSPPQDSAATGASNEPAGMTRIFDRPFNAINEAGWSDEFSGTMAFVQDASAPRSPATVLRATYPTGYTSAGVGPGSGEVKISSGTRTVYVSYWGMFSSNWYGHDSGVNKEFYLWANGTPYMYFNARCRFTGAITPDIALQDMAAGGDYDISPNLVPTARITRGKWFHVEVVAVGNTANTSNGSLDWWMDGVHIGSYKNLRFSNTAAHWDLFHYSTIWGGVGGPNVPATQYKQWDHAYMSGKAG